MTYRVSYPRKRLVRAIMRALGRILVRTFARVEIHGLDRFPREGPVLVVGNHTGAMEVVLLTIYAPRLVEYLGSVDIPHEGYIAVFINAYGFIPVFRGKASRAALEGALDVLRQGGVLGLFPEGGIWEPAIRRAQAGVAWLSYHGQASILPIGFGSTRGALVDILRLRRPRLTMYVGSVMPPVELEAGSPRKETLQRASDHIVDAIWALVPPDEQPDQVPIEDESFAFEVEVIDSYGSPVAIPADLKMKHGPALSKFIHRNTLFNNLLQNLDLPIRPLKKLHQKPEMTDLIQATRAILAYLDNDNPHYFTYRYGSDEGAAMGKGVREFHRLLKWAYENGISIHATPVRQFRHSQSGKFYRHTIPQETDKW